MTKKKAMIGVGAALGLVAVIGIIIFAVNCITTVKYWDVKVGNETVAVFATEEEGAAVVQEIENRYVKEGAEVQSVEVTPPLAVVETTYKKKEAPALTEKPKAVAEHLLKGEKEEVTYQVRDGDTIWEIAYKNDLTLDEIKKMNPDLDLESIYPGDKLVFSELDPIVDVTVVQRLTSIKKIPFKTVERKSSKITMGSTKVKQKGRAGKQRVTELITSVNGKNTKVVVEQKTVLRRAKKQIVLVGTGPASLKKDGRTYNGNGQAIADYALQFVGNPYSYGGTSLTNGADCSGFVLAVYRHFGISLPHDADAMVNYGRSVSVSEAAPGDIVCYSGHCAIYIGGGQIVHAIDYGYDIGITGLNYSGKPVLDVRRLVE